MDEKELVKRAKQGDRTAMELLYRSTFTYIYKYVLSSVNDRDVTDDLVSNIFLNAFTKIAQFRGESTFKTWLHMLARNEIFTFYRGKAVTSRIVNFDEDFLESSFSAEIDIEQEEKQIALKEIDVEKRVAEVLNVLHPRYAEILKLRYLSGMTIKETSQYLKITENNVKVLQNRAIKQASKLLGVENEI